MKIAVCDSCCDDMEKLLQLLKIYHEVRSLPLTLNAYFDFDDLLCDVSGGSFEFVFLGEIGNVCYLVQQLKREQFGGSLVLMGKSERLAVRGYDVGADGFLLKPISMNSLSSLMSRLAAASSEELSFYSEGRLWRIMQDEISFVETRSSVCLIHTTSGKELRVRKPLREINDALGEQFLRCHKSYIVNMKHIAYADDDFIMDSGERVLIRKRENRALKERVMNYSKRH